MEKLKAKFSLFLSHPFVKSFLMHLKESEMSLISIAVAFYLLLSLFPLFMTLGNLLPFLNFNSEQMILYIKQFIPSNIFENLRGTLIHLLTQKDSSALSLSVLATLWAATQGIASLQTALDKAYGVKKQRNFIIHRILSLFTLCLLLLMVVLGVLILGFGKSIFHFIQKQFDLTDNFRNILANTTGMIAFIGIFFLLCLFYYIVPNVVIRKIKYLLPGAIFSTVMTYILSKLFSFYTTYFATTVSNYQMIGTVIVLMLWLVFAARILILGSVINSVVQELSEERQVEVRSEKVKHLIKNKMNEKSRDQ